MLHPAPARSATPIPALLVDSHSEIRYLLGSVLDSDGRIWINLEAADAEEAFVVFADMGTDLAIVDLSIKGGLELITRLRLRRPTVALAALGHTLDEATCVAAVAAGADLVLTKDTLTQTMCDDLVTIVETRARRTALAA